MIKFLENLLPCSMLCRYTSVNCCHGCEHIGVHDMHDMEKEMKCGECEEAEEQSKSFIEVADSRSNHIIVCGLSQELSLQLAANVAHCHGGIVVVISKDQLSNPPTYSVKGMKSIKDISENNILFLYPKTAMEYTKCLTHLCMQDHLHVVAILVYNIDAFYELYEESGNERAADDKECSMNVFKQISKLVAVTEECVAHCSKRTINQCGLLISLSVKCEQLKSKASQIWEFKQIDDGHEMTVDTPGFGKLCVSLHKEETTLVPKCQSFTREIQNIVIQIH